MTSPFGIDFFSDLASLTVTDEFGQAKYGVIPPSPHPLFDTCIVQATSSLGIVWIKASSPAKQIDAFGNSLRSEVDRVAQQLASKCGQGRKSDILLNGALWDEPQYWMNALEDGQRIYAYFWEKSARARIPDDLDSIYVGAAGYGGGQGAVGVEYASSKMVIAEREIEASMSDLL